MSVPVFLAISGCIPAEFSGYLPNGPGTLVRRYCAGPGVKDVLRVQAYSGVRIETHAGWNRHNDTIELEVSMTVPTKVTVQLLEPQLLLQSREWTEPHVLLVDRIMGSGSRPGSNRYSPLEKLSGASDSPGVFGLWFLKGDKGTLFQTNIPKVNSFTLQFPPLRINNKIFRMDPIHFEVYKKWSVYTCVQ